MTPGPLLYLMRANVWYITSIPEKFDKNNRFKMTFFRIWKVFPGFPDWGWKPLGFSWFPWLDKVVRFFSLIPLISGNLTDGFWENCFDAFTTSMDVTSSSPEFWFVSQSSISYRSIFRKHAFGQLTISDCSEEWRVQPEVNFSKWTSASVRSSAWTWLSWEFPWKHSHLLFRVWPSDAVSTIVCKHIWGHKLYTDKFSVFRGW